jgi:hypothetical protein
MDLSCIEDDVIRKEYERNIKLGEALNNLKDNYQT